MSTPLHANMTGTFTTDASPSPVILSLPAGANEIEIINITDSNSRANAIVKAKGYSALAAGYADIYTNAGVGGGYVTATTEIVSGGFTFFSDSAGQSPSAATAITAINRANPAVVSTGDTSTVPLAAGDVVRVYGTTGMLQISSMDFSVGTVVANTSFQLKYLSNGGFAADATAGFWRKLSFRSGPSVNVGGIAPDPRFYPRARYITAITAANPAVVTLSVAHGFVVGEKVRIIVPDNFGMTQINNYLATVTAVSYTNNTITLDIDSSAFTAFAFPTSAVAALGTTFAQVVPVGEAAITPYGNFLFDATRNASINGVIVGASCLVASKNYQWIAKRGITLA